MVMASRFSKKMHKEMNASGDIGALGLKWHCVCKTCDRYGYFHYSSRKGHVIDNHMQDRPYKCSKCGLARGIKLNVSRHIQTAHKNERGIKVIEYPIDEKEVNRLVEENFLLKEDVQTNVVAAKRRRTIVPTISHDTVVEHSAPKKRGRAKSIEIGTKRRKSLVLADKASAADTDDDNLHTEEAHSLKQNDKIGEARLNPHRGNTMFFQDCRVCDGKSCGRSAKERMEHCLAVHMRVCPWICSKCDYQRYYRWTMLQHAAKEHKEHSAEQCIVATNYDKDKLRQWMKKCFLQRKHWSDYESILPMGELKIVKKRKSRLQNVETGESDGHDMKLAADRVKKISGKRLQGKSARKSDINSKSDRHKKVLKTPSSSTRSSRSNSNSRPSVRSATALKSQEASIPSESPSPSVLKVEQSWTELSESTGDQSGFDTSLQKFIAVDGNIENSDDELTEAEEGAKAVLIENEQNKVTGSNIDSKKMVSGSREPVKKVAKNNLRIHEKVRCKLCSVSCTQRGMAGHCQFAHCNQRRYKCAKCAHSCRMSNGCQMKLHMKTKHGYEGKPIQLAIDMPALQRSMKECFGVTLKERAFLASHGHNKRAGITKDMLQGKPRSIPDSNASLDRNSNQLLKDTSEHSRLNESSDGGGIFPRIDKFLNGTQGSNDSHGNDETPEQSILRFEQLNAAKRTELARIEAELETLQQVTDDGDTETLEGELQEAKKQYGKEKEKMMQTELFMPFIGLEEYFGNDSVDCALPISQVVPYTRYKWFGWSFGSIGDCFIVLQGNIALLFGNTSCHVCTSGEVLEVDLESGQLRTCGIADSQAVMHTAKQFAPNCALDKDFTKQEYTRVRFDECNLVCSKVSVGRRECLAVVPSTHNNLCKILVFKNFPGVWVVGQNEKVQPIRVM